VKKQGVAIPALNRGAASGQDQIKRGEKKSSIEEQTRRQARKLIGRSAAKIGGASAERSARPQSRKIAAIGIIDVRSLTTLK
jgi:hypothetical protein